MREDWVGGGGGRKVACMEVHGCHTLNSRQIFNTFVYLVTCYSKEGSCGADYKTKASITSIGSDCEAMGGSPRYSGITWGDCTLDVCQLDSPSSDSYAAAQVVI